MKRLVKIWITIWMLAQPHAPLAQELAIESLGELNTKCEDTLEKCEILVYTQDKKIQLQDDIIHEQIDMIAELSEQNKKKPESAVGKILLVFLGIGVGALISQ